MLRRYTGARPISVSIFVVLILLVTYLVSGRALGVSTVALAGTSLSPAACLPSEVESQVSVAVAATNQSLAESAAVNSSAYQQAIAESGAITSVDFVSVYDSYTVSRVSCEVSIEATDVAFNIVNATGAYQLTLAESATNGAIGGSIVSLLPPQTAPLPNSPPARWNGWTFDTPGISASGAWEIPSVSNPSGSNYCGGNKLIVNICQLSSWAGQMSASSNSTIAQAGSFATVKCSWFLGWSCPASYSIWFEFYPSSATICSSVSVHAVDEISVLSQWNTSGRSHFYFEDVYDQTGSAGCAAVGPSNFTQGSPDTGNFIDEQQYSGGTWADIPAFTYQQFAMADPLGHYYNCSASGHIAKINDLLCLSYQEWQNNSPSPLNTTGPFYGHHGTVQNCLSYTCFNETYV